MPLWFNRCYAGGVLISDLPTPCALVDLEQLERNTRRVADKARRLGVRLRPHVKTHKCVEIARIQTDLHFGGVTVSTLAEAHAFADQMERYLASDGNPGGNYDAALAAAMEAYEHCKNAVQRGEVPVERLKASLDRIAGIKFKLGKSVLY